VGGEASCYYVGGGCLDLGICYIHSSCFSLNYELDSYQHYKSEDECSDRVAGILIFPWTPSPPPYCGIIAILGAHA